MTHHRMDKNAEEPARVSRRTMSTRGLAAGLAVPAVALGTMNASAQATPEAEGRVTINPGEVLSSAVVANGFVFTSGALGIDPETGELAGEDITSQTEQMLANLEATLTAAGSSFDKVVKSTCYLASLDDFEAFNEVYKAAFPADPPSRSTVQVAGLVFGAKVEIDLIAVI